MPDRSLRLPPLLLRERRPSSTPHRPEGDGSPGGGSGSAGGNGSGRAGGSDDGTPEEHGPGTPAAGPADLSKPSASPGSSGRSGAPAPEDNPFAPPPEGTPDRPWQPRGHDRDSEGGGEDGDSGSGRSPWGSHWSDRQPGPSSGGGFGDRPGAPKGQGGGPEGQGGGPGSGMRWDPTDPAQRRARYALLSGMWAFFFALFNWPYVALLLGALALYWGVSALRGKARTAAPKAPAPEAEARPQQAAPNGRPQVTAAVSGLVTASLAVLMVAGTFTAQLVYRDYYSCTQDALTTAAKHSCNDLLPKELRGVLGTSS
ncbi:hypothetical protein ACGFS9_17365 [Streptomyces sp. NPDC048566]|uniref:hypothetical protein n=1 Tax=Streptomyces sp. NPDC048566 TaxID=3365569 RepID=UPI003716604B